MFRKDGELGGKNTDYVRDDNVFVVISEAK